MPIGVCNLDSNEQVGGVSNSTYDSIPCLQESPILTSCGVHSKEIDRLWYGFTCSAPGTFGLTITPFRNDNWDWELFDISGHADANDVYTDPSLIVACNWSNNTAKNPGYTSVTGTADTATSLFVCFSNPPFSNASTFSAMPLLKPQHTYLLLVCSSVYEPGTGYKMSVAGGTAVFSSYISPRFHAVYAFCGALTLPVKLSQTIPCNSFAANGSDFSIAGYSGSITTATGIGCDVGSYTDSLLLSLSSPLSAGTYTLYAKTKSDGKCEHPPLYDSIRFTIPPLPTPMDSLVVPACAPASLQLYFQDFMYCDSIAKDGSDFKVNGPQAVTVTGASGICTAKGFTHNINVSLSAPITVAGTYTVSLVKGDDGNTLVNACGVATPAGASLPFTVAKAVSAAFTYQLHSGCSSDTIVYTSDANSGATQWNWTLGTDDSSLVQNPVQIINRNTNNLHVIHNVSNGFCSDIASIDISLPAGNRLKAAFSISSVACPNEGAVITNNSSGDISQWLWNFGDGTTSSLQLPPPHFYPLPVISKDYSVTLRVQDILGCSDSTVNPVKAVTGCTLRVPSAFTPNGDGLNDYLSPLNAYKADHIVFTIYNRWGQMIFTTQNGNNKWNGTFGGSPQPSGVYMWQLTYTDHDTHKTITQIGTAMLIR